MSKPTDNDLLEMVDALVASKTFNLDALDGIKELKDNLKKTLAERDQLREHAGGLKRQLTDALDAIHEKDGRIASLTKEVESMKKAVEDGKKAVYDADKHQAVAYAWQSAMAMVFKPNAVRESVQRNHTVVVPSSSGASYTQAVQHQDNIVREDA